MRLAVQRFSYWRCCRPSVTTLAIFRTNAAGDSNPVWAVLEIGGERGIRTLEGLLTLTPLAGVRLRPLGHLSDG